MPDDLEDKILTEMRQMREWISLADALKVVGTNSWVADREAVRSVLHCVDASGRLRLGRVDTRYREIPKPLPVAALLDRIFSEEDASDRSFAMMQLFIDEMR